jgi:hypothetical protein
LVQSQGRTSVFNLILLKVPGRENATARAVEGVRVRGGSAAPTGLTVIEGRSLHGVVIDRDTDRPVAATQVGCYGPSRPPSGLRGMECKTDEQGRFAFHVPPGAHDVYLMDFGLIGRLGGRIVTVTDRGELGDVLLLRRGGANIPPMGFAAPPAPAGAPVAVVVAPLDPVPAPAPIAVEALVPGAAQEEAKASTATAARTVTGHVRDLHMILWPPTTMGCSSSRGCLAVPW